MKINKVIYKISDTHTNNIDKSIVHEPKQIFQKTHSDNKGRRDKAILFDETGNSRHGKGIHRFIIRRMLCS